MITGSTLNFWVLKLGLDKKLLGIFGLISLPYSINFLWMPIFDSVEFNGKIFGLSKKDSSKLIWLVLLMGSLIISINLMSLSSDNFFYLAFASFITAFFSASKDGLLGGLKASILDAEKVYQYSGAYIISYRIGMLFSSAGAIYLSSYYDWSTIYFIFSLLVFIFGGITCLVWYRIKFLEINMALKKEIDIDESAPKYINVNTLSKALSSTSFKYTGYFVIFLSCYKLADNLIGVMINAFLLDKSYSDFEIACYSKALGTCGAIVGGGLASKYMKDFTKVRSNLVNFGILHAFSHIFLIFQALIEKNVLILAISVIFSSITSGMTMSCYMAAIILKSRGEYQATQYAFYTSIMGLSRVVLPILSGIIISYFDWIWYFSICFILSLLGLSTTKLLDSKKLFDSEE